MSLTNAELSKIIHLDLSADSRFLLILMMQHRPAPCGPWTFYLGSLMKSTGWGRDKVKNRINDLKKLGFVQEPRRNNSGQNGAGYRLTKDAHRILKTSNWKSVSLISFTKADVGLADRSRQFCLEDDALLEPVSSASNESRIETSHNLVSDRGEPTEETMNGTEAFREFAPLAAYESDINGNQDEALELTSSSCADGTDWPTHDA